ncbi:hypothetical protein C0989_004293 [Termitomyces sp. Mn162]|nr:hypothetical protein C0989_004293 [Termitomyces sp. Mn162]
MPSPTSPCCKLPTAPCAAAALPTVSSEPPIHVALINCSVKQSANDVIVAILYYPAFASALLGHISTAKALPIGAADCTHFISAINLMSLVIFPSSTLIHLAFLQFFADQTDFPQIAEQQGLFDTLSLLFTSKTLDCFVNNTSTAAKAFFVFADAIISIKSKHYKACKKELEELCHHAQDKMLPC